MFSPCRHSSKKQVKVFNYHKTEATPVFVQRFFKIQNLFPVADRVLRLSEQK